MAVCGMGSAARSRRARLGGGLVRAAVLAGSVAAAWAWECSTDVALGPTRSTSKKGIALDDSTWRGCASKIPSAWPNDGEPVKSLRLFRSWDKAWPEGDRMESWKALVKFTHDNGAKIFVGTQITCSEEDDERDWAWTKELMQMLGREHIMGVSIGNELELLASKKGSSETCATELWEGGRLWRDFQSRVEELGALGLQDVPITSVFTGTGLGSGDTMQFMEIPGEALVHTFIGQATKKYGSRFVFAFNFYPYFDPNLRFDENATGQCAAALSIATCFNSSSCLVNSGVTLARAKAQSIANGRPQVWIGETGWSSPASSTLDTEMSHCEAWSSQSTLEKVYDNFLSWDLDRSSAPDHAFYFTARDSWNFGNLEHFGLIDSCLDPRCKVRSEHYKGRPLAWLSLVWLALSACAGLGAVCLICAGAASARRARAKALLNIDAEAGAAIA